MKKVKEVNIYFFIIMLLQLFLPVYIIFRALNINDIRMMLVINHIIVFIIPAFIYLLITKQSPKKVLRLNKLHIKDIFIIICLSFICQPIMTFLSLISQFFFENEIGNFIGEVVNSPYWILLLLIAITIISNTIKLTVHARRKEISIMKYVGATNGFIRLPFVVEGIVIGIMSALIAILILAGLYNVIIGNIESSNVLQKMGVNLLQFSDIINSIIIVFLGLGIGIGITGSAISMKKYLDV
jgi:hypothetical protein